MILTKSLLIIAFAFIAFSVRATITTAPKQIMNHKAWSFIENKGQLKDESGNLLSNIKYYGHQGGVNLYCKPGLISFVFTKIEKENNKPVFEASGLPALSSALKQQLAKPSKLIASRADLLLLNSNSNAEVIASEQQEYFENFYNTSNVNAGITNVHTYKTIIYKSIYKHIDLILHAHEEGMKYEFVVNPGGKVSDIQIQWNGLENMKLASNGGIIYSTNTGFFKESSPQIFQGNNIVNGNFVKENNHLAFKIASYDHAKKLVIDPLITWSTYYGGGGQDYNNAIATDQFQNIYIMGTTYSATGIATSGAYQTTHYGPYGDIFIAKFRSYDKIVWATYYGNTGDDQGTGIAVDANNNPIILGWTASPNMATFGAYQTAINSGTTAMILTKFTPSGSISWATYYGGNYPDGPKAIITDTGSNIYISGIAVSSTGLATSGAYQTSIGSKTDNDGILAKFDPAGNILWATYFGGKGDDRIFGLALNNDNSVIVTGMSQSTNGIAKSGAYQSSLKGTTNAFLANFSPAGVLKWSTYYGGSQFDYFQCVKCDKSGNIVCSGYAESTGLATSGVYQTSFSGSESPLISRFSSSGSLQWTTYFGGQSTQLFGMSTSEQNNIFLTGSTYETSGIATSGAFQTKFTGNVDGFISEFGPTGNLVWGTYVAGDAVTQMFDLKMTKTRILYALGNTSSSAMATPGAYQTSGGGLDDGLLMKIDFNNYVDAGIASILSPILSTCPGTKTVGVLLENFGISELDSLIIGWSINGKLQKPYSWTGTLMSDTFLALNIGSYLFTSGKDTIKAWTYNPNGINDSTAENDTAKFIFTAFAQPAANVGKSKSICIGNTDTIGSASVSGNTYLWTSQPSGFTATISNPIVAPTNSTTFFLTETNTTTGCSKRDSVSIVVNPLPAANVASSSSICAGSSINIGSSSLLSSSYAWKSSPAGFSSSDANPDVNPINSITYTLTETKKATGCSKSNTVKITVNPVPVAKWFLNYSGDQAYLHATDSGLTNTSYHWDLGDGTLDSVSGHLIKHVYPKNKSYQVKLKVSSAGCINELDSNINITISGIGDKEMEVISLNLYPNPFQSTTTIQYNLTRNANVNISIFDATGKQMGVITNEMQTTGQHQYEINALNYKIFPGIYLLKIMFDDNYALKQMVKF